MRVLFTSVPAPSHIDPLLHLARALDVDHEVTIATGPALVPMVQKAGIDAVAVGLDWTEPEADATFPELRGLPLPEMERWWVRNIFFDRAAHPMAADVGALLDAEPFDLLIRTYVEVGGWAAAAARDVPQTVVQLGRPFGTEVLGIVAELLTPILGRIAPDREVDPVAAAYGDLSVMLHPESYWGWTPPVPFIRTRPPVRWPDATPPPRPDVLDGAPDLPVVLVTFGTVFNRTPGVFEVVLEALADLPVTAIVTVGSTRDPAELGPVADNVRLHRFVPYADLLPHCDLVLAHGGFGTTMSALVHGIPVVIMPLGSDQPWNGANCQALGFGEVVAFDGATPSEVADAVLRVLGDPGYRDRVLAYRDELAAQPTTADAARAIAARFGPTDRRPA